MTFYDGRYPSHPHKAAINAYRLRSNKEFRKRKTTGKRFNELSLPVSLLPILIATNVPRFYEEREANLQKITLTKHCSTLFDDSFRLPACTFVNTFTGESNVWLCVLKVVGDLRSSGRSRI